MDDLWPAASARKRLPIAAILFSLLAFCGVASSLGQVPAQTPDSPPGTRPTLVFKQFAPGKPIRFIAYGDMRFTDPSVTSGTNPKVRSWLAQKIGEEHPQALFLTGDMPFTGEKLSDWDEYRRETSSWTAGGFPVLPCIGNHEIYHDRAKGIANYLAAYPQVEGHRYYSALLGPIEVISLDMTSPVGPHSDQLRWFIAQLEHIPPTVEFVFILHHIPWVADTQSQLLANVPSKDSLIFRNALESRVDHLHAKVVFVSGHIHNYERFERHGIEYLISGGGGAEPYPLLFRGSHDLYRDTGYPVYHYITFELANHQLHATMWKVIDPDAPTLNVEAKDSFTIKAIGTGAKVNSAPIQSAKTKKP